MNNNKQLKYGHSVSIKQAADYLQNGNITAAESHCCQILKNEPRNPDALHLLGVLHHYSKKDKTAIKFISQAIAIVPSNPYYYNSLGLVMQSVEKFDNAMQCYQKSLNLQPDYIEAICNIAGLFYISGRYLEALQFYKNALDINPNFPEVLNNMAATFNLMEKYDEAIVYCKNAIKIKPDYSEPYNNMANAYSATGNQSLAIRCYEEAIKLGGGRAEVLCNLANALAETGSIDRAISNYKTAIELDPAYGKAYNNLGTVFRSRRDFKRAEIQFKKCISLIPEDHQAYHNMGNIYYDQGDYASAARWYDKAISINPRSIQTFINRGIIFQECGESNDALECFNMALAIDTNNSKALCHKVHELYQRCEWTDLDELRCKISDLSKQELAQGILPSEMPFLCLIRTGDPIINFHIAQRWSQEVQKSITEFQYSDKYSKNHSYKEKISVGYLSNNFRNHPTAHLINQIFDFHDRKRFSIHVYSYGEKDDSLYRRCIQQKADRFIDIRELNHDAAAQRIHEDRIDILVDLVGYMRANRLEICAYRPAPIQVRWLGLAGTTGANFFDYLITDEIVTPANEQSVYSEKFVYMPDTYQVNSKPLEMPISKYFRKDLMLPADAFVYSSFCSSYKIDKRIFSLWMDILKNTPKSILWLIRSNDIVEENLKAEAKRHRVDPDRLIFAEKIPKADHLERLKLADVALDTRAVNGAATTSDALWAGVPVLAIKGTHFASRMSSSILKAIGMENLVMENENAYKQQAIIYGNNRTLIEKLKRRLKVNRSRMPLFDTQRFVLNLEKAYKMMWGNYQSGKKPRMIRVS